MRVGLPTFRGEVPRVDPTKLPENFAEQASNPRLLAGTLQAWKNFSNVITLSKSTPINTIYYLAQQYWLEWNDSELDTGAVCVDVARGIIPGDTTYRTYLTGLDAPRFTNLSLASVGGPPYPVETRLLGVIAPTTAPTLVTAVIPDDPPINVTDDMSVASNWTYCPSFSSGGALRSATQYSTGGNPGARIQIRAAGTGTLAYVVRETGAGGCANIVFQGDFIWNQAPSDPDSGPAVSWKVFNSPEGKGVTINFTSAGASTFMSFAIAESFASSGAAQSTAASIALSTGVWYTARIEVNRTSSTAADVKIQILNGATVLDEKTATNLPVYGGWCGWGTSTDLFTSMDVSVDNLLVQGSGSFDEVTTPPATSYVYTFVNDFGEESAPSPASITILRDEGTSVTVTTETVPPTGPDYHVETKRIYRAVTGATGTSFQFVAEIPLADAEYVDNIPDSGLGEALESDNWDLPPSDLRNILALPNGIMVGFRRNQVCFSAQNHPHAWPVEYRINTDTDIVALGAIDTSVVITTKAFPYIAAGNNPAAYSMAKLEEPQGCVSKRSLSYLRGFGVVYASADGLMAINGPGKPTNITEGIFTKLEWQALNPASIIATFHDDRYWAFYDNGTTKAGFVIDVRQAGFGKISLAFHATAVYTDPLTDILYLVLDENEEPSDPLGEVPVDVPAPGDIVYSVDTDEENKLAYSYTTKLWETGSPTNFQYCRVRARDYANIVVKFYVDGVNVYSKRILNNQPFTLPAVAAENTFQMKLIGTSTITQIDAAEQVDELN